MPPPVVHVVGARPNFIKAAPVIGALGRRGVAQRLVHTGQHYDAALSDVFFRGPRPARARRQPGRRLGHPRRPDRGARWSRWRAPSLPLRAGARGRLRRRELDPRRCARVRQARASRMAHVEAGLRSFDMTMPEEVNRRVTDVLSDLLLRDQPGGARQPRPRGRRGRARCHLVGNPMIDTLLAHLDRVRPGAGARPRSGLSGPYARGHAPPARQRGRARRRRRASSPPPRARRAAAGRPAAASRAVGPRWRRRGSPSVPGIHVVDPLGYLDFLSLVARRGPRGHRQSAASRRRRPSWASRA